MKYLTSLVTEKQAANLASTFATIIANMLACPISKLDEISTFSSHNRELVQRWNRDQPALVNKCVHEFLQEFALLQPNAEAITSWDQSFTYKELDDVSTRIAHHLQSLGVGPDVLVPVCMEKSAWAIVSMLAAIKAGGAFVPLDPAHPENRLQSVLDDCNSQLVIASPATAEKFAKLPLEVVVLSATTPLDFPQKSGYCMSGVTPANMVYTLFTSGSTGKPKGVVLDHAAVSSSVIHHGREFGFTAAARVFQFSAYTFDAMCMEIFTTLAYGGCICVPSETERLGNFGKAMAKMNVNLSYLTASVVRLLKPQDVPSLKILVTGGEAVGQDIVATWAEKLRFIGSYGPTECCFTCTLGIYEAADSAANSIGVAVGSLGWVVEPKNHNKLAAVGAIGELIMSGHILARGYLNNPEKTALGFIEDPAWLTEDRTSWCAEMSSPNLATRFYKTGDLVRYNSDGTMVFLGRKDQQVKLRGLRIEVSLYSDLWISTYVRVLFFFGVRELGSMAPEILLFKYYADS